MSVDGGNIIVGITSAYKFQVNEFREAILANNLKKELISKGINSKLILFNDDIDAFTQRHLKLFSKIFPYLDYNKYLGVPICFIPSPSINFNSLSDYFLNEYLKDIANLGIKFDKIVSSNKIRKSQKFLKVSKIILEKKNEIIKLIKNEFDLDYSSKYINFLNENSYKYSPENSDSNIFKFPWSIECLIRWYLLDIDFEFFTKNYLTKPKGSYYVSSKVFYYIFKKKPPEAMKYEFIRFNSEHKIISSLLPKDLFINLLQRNINSYTYINLDSCMVLLHENKYLGTNKSIYEVLNFLSHFNLDNFNNLEFKDNLEKIYFKKIISDPDFCDLSKKVKIFKKYFFQNCEEENVVEERINFYLVKFFSEIEILKSNLDNYDLFNKELKRLFINFKKEDYFILNFLFYKKKNGISIPLYLYITPKLELKKIKEKFFLDYFKFNFLSSANNSIGVKMR